jgi:AraC-like DNA-binding protein
MLPKKAGILNGFPDILAGDDSFLAFRDSSAVESDVFWRKMGMDSIVDMLFLPQLFKYGFTEKAKNIRDGPMNFALKRSYGEGTYWVKPAGKSLVVSVTDFSYRQQVELAWEQPEYFHISFLRENKRGIFGHIGKDNVYRQHYPAGFRHYAMGVSFLPDFFDALLGSRHGISQDELIQALIALNQFSSPPGAALVLKQIGDAACDGNAGNAWLEAKTLELVSLVLEWHKRIGTTAPPRLNEQDRAGIACALHYAEEYFAGPVSLEALSKQAAMSVSKFTAAFKLHTGISAAAYIHRLRMERAMDLLKNTVCPIGEIAGAVGYKRHASFSATFREEFGVAPAALRRGNDKEKYNRSQ